MGGQRSAESSKQNIASYVFVMIHETTRTMDVVDRGGGVAIPTALSTCRRIYIRGSKPRVVGLLISR